MPKYLDEGFIDEDIGGRREEVLSSLTSMQECEDLAYLLLATLPRSRLATIQRRLAPLLQFDLVGSLPDEISLQIFSRLSYDSLLICGSICQRWNALANDQTLWRSLCASRGWEWRQPPKISSSLPFEHSRFQVSDDEGMGDSDEEADEDEVFGSLTQNIDTTAISSEMDSGFVSMSNNAGPSSIEPIKGNSRTYVRHSAPPILNSSVPTIIRPDYKLLYRTHTKLRNRFLSSSYNVSALQTRGAPTNAHTNTIYCLQLYTYPETGEQVLFTGSRDKTVREWNISTGLVKRVIGDMHLSSVLSICVHNGILASGGSDHSVVVWDLKRDCLIKSIREHHDSVLCVRMDSDRLVSCSKDRTVRVYTLPDLHLQNVLTGHRAAVNAVSISSDYIVSGSGDRSVRLWDAHNGELLRSFENHHSRGIASIDFIPPYILSGSSDRHVRICDINTLQGWSTSDESEPSLAEPGNPLQATPSMVVCNACGSPNTRIPTTTVVPHGFGREPRRAHKDLVRSVALADDYVISGSYDLTVKVWDRKTGALIADLTNGHTGRIFCVGFDYTKVVSCGEDQRICIWDFSNGIDTSFIQL